MATYLDRIVGAHRTAAAADPRSTEELIGRASSLSRPRPFCEALVAGDELGVIAEIKRRSPSKGDLRPDLDPRALASEYESGGAACLSVLTDTEFFGGAAADLVAARDACALPVLRKDFTVSANDVCDARLMGADAVLLIVAALSDDELRGLSELAVSLDLDVLVETHDELELERALAHSSAGMIGVNQRDLLSFAVDPDRAVRMGPMIPDGYVRVAESGVQGPADARRLSEAGFHAILVGEALVVSGDAAGAVRELRVPR
ncbi:MAG: Indole-3-glycerol phosphate synthase [Acidimicrobiales bacterium]|nr:MAG: indole-3-glycerol-phosphate synthase [Actinomycetota bacterium]MBV6509550.1 Indole-3-glycerol phosphate synthase [Acidimicrobiales bacterium]RIK06586.1 MAG: indole-3-glycerol-phosphate synthase TrpC [Acidobacteriota bacterium]